MRKVPNTIWTRAENGQNPIQKTLSRYRWNPPKTIFWASRNLALEHRFRKPRTAKHSGSLRCEKSQTPSGHEPKTAKTWSKKLFHVTFGIHKKQSFGPQGHMPSLSNHRQFLHWNRSEIVSNSGLGMHFRKPRTAARFVPKSCETAARKSA